jgi:hypothetical protein
MPDAPNSLPAALRHIRIVWGSLLFVQFLYILAGPMMLGDTPQPKADPSFTIGTAIAGICALSLVLFFRFRFVRRASEALQSNADAAAIARWRKLQITTMVLVETPPLYGLILLLTTGAPLKQVAPFYAVGIAAMLFVYPKNPAGQS